MKALFLDAYVSLRDVVRQGRRTLTSGLAVTAGTVALLLAGGFIEWTFWAMREGAIRSGLGHIQIVRTGYMEFGTADPFAYMLPSQSPLRDAIARLPHVRKVAPRIAFAGLAGFRESSLSFIASGFDPSIEGGLDNISGLEAGELLSPGDQAEILLGRGLAENLGARVGDTLVLLVNRGGGTLGGIDVKVKGIFFTVTKAYDDVALHIPFATAQQLLEATGAHIWVVHLDDTANTATVLQDLQERLPAGFKAVPWYELADFYNKTVKLFSKQVLVMKLIIAAVIVFTISNAMMMNVSERIQEIGTAMALGLRRNRVLSRFVFEGAFIGIIGGVVGIVLGLVLAAGISRVGIPMPPPPGMSKGFSGEILVTPRLVLDGLVLAVATTIIASVYPAWKASRIRIVDALRQGR